jgi:hypothetical protein
VRAGTKQQRTVAVFVSVCANFLGKEGLKVPKELFRLLTKCRGEVAAIGGNLPSWIESFFHAEITPEILGIFLDCLGQDLRSQKLDHQAFQDAAKRTLEAVCQLSLPEADQLPLIQSTLETIRWIGEDLQAAISLCQSFPAVPVLRLKGLELRLQGNNTVIEAEVENELDPLLSIGGNWLRLECARLKSAWLRMIGRSEENRKLWIAMIQKNPECASIRVAAAESHFLDKNAQLGRGTYAPVIDSGKLTPSEWLDILEMESENPQTLRNLAQKASKRFPSDPAIRVREGELFPESMKGRVQELAKLFPNSTEVCLLVAKVFLVENKKEKAKSWLLKALEMDPLNADGKGYLVLLDPGMRGEATRRFKESGPPSGDRYLRFLRRSRFWGASGTDKERLFEGFVEWLSHKK